VKPKIAALLPMRHDSERVPGKNYRPFAGRPLFHHVLSTLRSCALIDEIAIDTDSPEVMRSVERDFPDVTLIERPAELRAGTVPMNDVIRHDLRLIEAELYLQTHCTNPLLRASTVTRAIETFLGQRDARDSLFSVTPVHKRFWDASGKPLNHDPAVLLRTQDLPPLYEENSCLYLFGRESMLATGSRIGARPLLFALDPVEAWDIDDEHDFVIAESLYRARAAEDRP
jgi:CMP-N-acetylneuraminic acid synthetase